MVSRLVAALLLLPCIALAEDIGSTLPGAVPGQPAPPLTVSKWLRGEPITHFEPGRMYAIDLWATWCAPCRETMPAMQRLDDKYGDDLTVVALNVWEIFPERVPGFFEERKDSMVHRVALDDVPDGKEGNEGVTALAYTANPVMSPFPQVYLIDAEGRVAWVGSPRELETHYLGVRDGTWDRTAFADSFQTAFATELRYIALLAPIEEQMMAEDWEKAFEACEAAVAADTSFVERIIQQGYRGLASRIVYGEEPTAAEGAIARRAAERAIALSPGPDWSLHELAADAAAAAGDNAGFRSHMLEAIAIAPENEKEPLRAKLEALDLDNKKD